MEEGLRWNRLTIDRFVLQVDRIVYNYMLFLYIIHSERFHEMENKTYKGKWFINFEL